MTAFASGQLYGASVVGNGVGLIHFGETGHIRISRHFATDRYLSRGGTVDARRSSPARLHYLRNRVDDCRLLREMGVVVRAWHSRVTFATAKKLPSLAAGTAAILVRRIAEARNGPRQIY
jgi:hypothetical protein